MFLGHFAVGFASKALAPRVSLGWLVGAPLLLDLVWPAFVLLGWERVSVIPGETAFTPLRFDSYPLTHSLLMALVWAAAFGVACWAACHDARGAVVVSGGVVSHWVCDIIVHRPDLPLWPGGPVVGLGLWSSVPATLALEVAALAAGALTYARVTRPSDRIGSVAWLGLVVVLAVLFFASAFGPPPPSATAVALVALAAWVFPLWASWVDRHRAARAGIAA